MSPSAEEDPAVLDALADEAEELDGYFSDAPLDPQPRYPPLDESLDSAIILTNLPNVPESKLDKLTKVITKTVSRIGTLAANADTDFSGVYMPLDKASGSTTGVCLVVYETALDAAKAVEVLQGYKFDKNHSLTVTPLSRAHALADMAHDLAADYVPPAPVPFSDPPNAVAWTQDNHQRDEFFIRAGKETVVYWWDAQKDPVVDYDGEREKEAGVVWCEYYCHWSPKGNYLATLVPARGVILWSGPNYEKVGRLVAPGVQQILFSPQETYVLTNNLDASDNAAVKVYEVRTGKLLRAFPLFPGGKVPEEGGPPPPPFRWSPDDSYLARQGDDLISIFETPGMRLLDQRSLPAPGIADFVWSPSDNTIAFWVRTAMQADAGSRWFCRIHLVSHLSLFSVTLPHNQP